MFTGYIRGLFMESTPSLSFCGIIYYDHFRSGDHLRACICTALAQLLDICEYNGSNVNLDFLSAAALFNQLNVTLMVLRSVSDGVVNTARTDTFQELCSCFSEIHLFWWNKMVEIGRRTTALADVGPRSVAVLKWCSKAEVCFSTGRPLT